MDKLFVRKIEVSGKTLCLVALNNEKADYDFSDLVGIVENEFTKLRGFIKNPVQILYIRDNPALSIEGKYPGGHTYFPAETMIAIPSWKNLSQKELIAVVAHELHHMARWQTVGYGSTLGGALTSEGFATYYEEIRCGTKPKWAEMNVSVEALDEARKQWGSKDYDHSQWFFNGPHGKWIGYSLGYTLAKKSLPQFDLKTSITIEPDKLLEVFM
ncbi:MAG TPA: DUF2268 domain-containing putative Zn-dependent protease [Candidatus Saccharimonadales bacterium]|jgi:uncharacterized protein YjaZ|nr:DUF2268 domain-containing putative Zn-dependent protease [Candidatus Saccharimonadales bacterium]